MAARILIAVEYALACESLPCEVQTRFSARAFRVLSPSFDFVTRVGVRCSNPTRLFGRATRLAYVKQEILRNRLMRRGETEFLEFV